MKNTITKLGGNQYKINGRTIDMDGLTVVSDEDYKKIYEAGLDNDSFIAPMHNDGDKEWELVAKYCVNYSGFDVDEYIKQNSEE